MLLRDHQIHKYVEHSITWAREPHDISLLNVKAAQKTDCHSSKFARSFSLQWVDEFTVRSLTWQKEALEAIK